MKELWKCEFHYLRECNYIYCSISKFTTLDSVGSVDRNNNLYAILLV
jgi:hypothetical protein